MVEICKFHRQRDDNTCEFVGKLKQEVVISDDEKHAIFAYENYTMLLDLTNGAIIDKIKQ